MERWLNKVAIVTGASSGIGAAVAEKLVHQGIIVAGFARRKEKLEQIAKKLEEAKGKFFPVVADVTNEDEVIASFDWVKRNLGPINILVNSAGTAKVNTIIDGDANKWKEVLDTNVFGLCLTTREAVKDMKKNNVDGHIILINSVTGHNVIRDPNINVYPASKFAVTALAETLRNEFLYNNLKIKITSLSPGFVETEIFEKAGINPSQLEMIKKGPLLKVNDVSECVLYLLGTPPDVEITELMIHPFGGQY